MTPAALAEHLARITNVIALVRDATADMHDAFKAGDLASVARSLPELEAALLEHHRNLETLTTLVADRS